VVAAVVLFLDLVCRVVRVFCKHMLGAGAARFSVLFSCIWLKVDCVDAAPALELGRFLAHRSSESLSRLAC
jgi:hypothetical protein